MSARITVRSFPSDDPEFADIVRAASAALISVPVEAVERCLEDILRQTYPDATVRRISELGAHEPGRLTWYAFRDARD